MKMLRTAVIAILTLSMTGAPAFAGELADSIAAAAASAAAEPQETPMLRTGNKTMVVAGSALFVTGMTYGLYQFINNENGSYSEFGEAESTSAKKGAVGISMAFAGGLVMLMGKRAKQMPSLTFSPKGLGVAKRVSW